MTLTFQPSTSFTETLSVVDAVLASVARRVPLHVSREDLASAGKLALVEALLRYEDRRSRPGRIAMCAFAARFSMNCAAWIRCRATPAPR